MKSKNKQVETMGIVKNIFSVNLQEQGTTTKLIITFIGFCVFLLILATLFGGYSLVSFATMKQPVYFGCFVYYFIFSLCIALFLILLCYIKIGFMDSIITTFQCVSMIAILATFVLFLLNVDFNQSLEKSDIQQMKRFMWYWNNTDFSKEIIALDKEIAISRIDTRINEVEASALLLIKEDLKNLEKMKQLFNN